MFFQFLCDKRTKIRLYLEDTSFLKKLTSQKITLNCSYLIALSDLLESTLRLRGSNNAADSDVLKYNICIKPQSSPNIKADSLLFPL